MVSNDFWISTDHSKGRNRLPPTYGGRRKTPDLPSRVRAAGKVAEAVVKIGKPYHTESRVKLALDYISRGLEEPLELRDGTVLAGDEDLDELDALASQWAVNFRDRSNARNAMPIILSAPPGSDPEALRNAARAWGQEVLGDEYDYAFALHTDEPHPHVHFVVVRENVLSRNLSWSRIEVDEIRETFARLAREQGIELNATPRATRGQTEKSESQAQRHARLRLGSSISDEGAGREVLDGLKSGVGEDEDPVWWTAMVQRAASERSSYEALAKAFERVGGRLGEDELGVVTQTSHMLARQSMALRMIATRRSQMRTLASRLNLSAMEDRDAAAKILAKAYRAERSDRELAQSIPAPATNEAIADQLDRFDASFGDRLASLAEEGDQEAGRVQDLLGSLSEPDGELER